MKNLWRVGCTLLVATALHAQTPVPTGEFLSPGAAATSFYRWYLDALDRHIVPTDDLRGPIRQRISLNLVLRLQRLLQNGDMEEDYFLKAQDFLPGWKTSVQARPAKTRAFSATTEVVLGAGSSEHELQVTLVWQDRRWKIDSVHSLRSPKSP